MNESEKNSKAKQIITNRKERQKKKKKKEKMA